MGWSASTTVRMAKRYGHIGQEAQRRAVEVLCDATPLENSEASTLTADNHDKLFAN